MSLSVTTALAIRFTPREYIAAFYWRVPARTCLRTVPNYGGLYGSKCGPEVVESWDHLGDRGFELSRDAPSGPVLCNCCINGDHFRAVWAYVPHTDAPTPTPGPPRLMSSYDALHTAPADIPGATLHVTKGGAVYLCLVRTQGNFVCDTAVFDEDMVAAIEQVDQLRRRTYQAHALRLVSWCTIESDLDA